MRRSKYSQSTTPMLPRLTNLLVTKLMTNSVSNRFSDSTLSQKNAPTLKRYSSEWYRSILMIFGRNIQKSLEYSLHVSVFM